MFVAWILSARHRVPLYMQWNFCSMCHVLRCNQALPRVTTITWQRPLYHVPDSATTESDDGDTMLPYVALCLLLWPVPSYFLFRGVCGRMVGRREPIVQVFACIYSDVSAMIEAVTIIRKIFTVLSIF